MGRVDGKIAFITGAARGQGRSHAVRLAEEGADIIAIDVLEDNDTIGYPMANESDMAKTVEEVESLGRRIIFEQADVRDLAGLERVVEQGLAAFGHIDIVCANAGIAGLGKAWELDEKTFQTMIDVNLIGVWKTLRATVPHMIEAGRGGSLILTAAIAGTAPYPNIAHYTAAKHGVVGLMRSFAIELGPYNIRANVVSPGNVDTMMIQNDLMDELMAGEASPDARQKKIPVLSAMHTLNVPWVEVRDISNAVLWLASDEARYVTGTISYVDAGALAPFKIPHSS